MVLQPLQSIAGNEVFIPVLVLPAGYQQGNP
jgi:hypothetical protein